MKCSRYTEAIKSFHAAVEKRAPKGERLLAALFPNRGTGWPGGWASNRIEEILHFRNWFYVGAHLLCSKIASLTPNTCFVHDQQQPGVTTKACQRALFNLAGPTKNGVGLHGKRYSYTGHGGTPFIDGAMPGWGGTTDTFLTMGEWRSKALSVVKPHEELEPLEGDHWLRRLIENPNSVDTWFDMSYEAQMFEELHGVYYVWKVPNRFGRTCELWVLPSHWVWPRTGGGKAPDGGVKNWMRKRGYTSWEYEEDGGDQTDGYRYGAQYVNADSPFYDRLIQYYEVRPWGGFGSSGVLRLPPNEVMMCRWKSPINKIDGYGKLSAVAQWIDSEESISKSRWAQFINQARPELWVEMPPGVAEPDDDMIERYATKFMKYVGEINMGRPIFTGGGAKVTPLSFSPTEMAYYQSEEQIRDMILSSLGVPKESVGVGSSVGTYGSLLAVLGALCQYGINPRLVKRGEDWTKHLASEFDEKPTGHNWSNGVSVGGDGAALVGGGADPNSGIRVRAKMETGGRFGFGEDYGRRVRLFYDDCTPADPTQVNSDLETDKAFHAVTTNEVRALRGRKPYPLGGNNPVVDGGPAGIIPLPWNEEEDVSKLAKVLEDLNKAQQAGQPQPGMMGGAGGEELDMSGFGQPPREEGQDLELEDEEGQQSEQEQTAEDMGGIAEPNGEPQQPKHLRNRIAKNLELTRLARVYVKARAQSERAAVEANGNGHASKEMTAVMDRLGEISKVAGKVAAETDGWAGVQKQLAALASDVKALKALKQQPAAPPEVEQLTKRLDRVTEEHNLLRGVMAGRNDAHRAELQAIIDKVTKEV